MNSVCKHCQPESFGIKIGVFYVYPDSMYWNYTLRYCGGSH